MASICAASVWRKPRTRRYEEIVFIDKAKRYYKKCIIHQDRLVGAILIGDKTEFQEFRELISQPDRAEREAPAAAAKRQQGGAGTGQAGVQLQQRGQREHPAEDNGRLHGSEELCAQTGAGTGCGSCRPEVKRILETTLRLELKEAALS